MIAFGQMLDDNVLPSPAKTPSGSELGHLEIGRRSLEHFHLGGKTGQAFLDMSFGVLEKDLVYDGQYGNLEQDRMEPRAFYGDAERIDLHFDVVRIKPDQPQEIDIVLLDEPQLAKPRQFVVVETEIAKTVYFVPDLVGIWYGETNVRSTAGKLVPDLRIGKLMQDGLLHSNLVEILIEQSFDYLIHLYHPWAIGIWRPVP
jgi:hypothetical protein